MGLASQLQEATRGRRKPSKLSKGLQVLSAAVKRHGGKFGSEPYDSTIEDCLLPRIESLLDSIYEGKDTRRKFKVTRTNLINDEIGSDSDGVWYGAEVEYPIEVKNTITASISPKKFAMCLVDELDIEPQSITKKVAADREVLAYAGKEVLAAIIKKWPKTHGDPADTVSKMADQAEEYAYEKSGDIEMSVYPDDAEAKIQSAKLKLEIRDASAKLSFVSPWKFKVETTYLLDGDFLWPHDRSYDKYM
jgi:hypothetical protein